MDENPKNWPVDRVSKLDAAQRQLRTAIRLFLEEGDAVSIYALTAASHEVLRKLVKAQGGISFLKDSDFIRPESQQKYEIFMNKTQNFFKHADRDPDEVLDFRPQMTDIWLIDCLTMHARLTGRFAVREFWLYTIWFMFEYPQLLKRDAIIPIPDGTWQLIQEQGHTKQFFLLLIDRPDLLQMPDEN